MPTSGKRNEGVNGVNYYPTQSLSAKMARRFVGRLEADLLRGIERDTLMELEMWVEDLLDQFVEESSR